MLTQVSEFVKDVLRRKTANEKASQSVFWGTLNLVILVAVLVELNSGNFSCMSKIIWWTCIGICVICSLNLLTHIKQYVGPFFITNSLEVTEKQKQLLSISDSDLGFKLSTPDRKSSIPVPEMSPKLSELFEATMASPAHSSIHNSPEMNSPHYKMSPQALFRSISPSGSLYSDTSISPGRSMNLSSFGGNNSFSVTANSWNFHRNSSLLDSSYNLITSPKRDVFNTSALDAILMNNSLSGNSPRNLGSPLSSSPILYHQPYRRNSISTKEELEEYIRDYREKERNMQILSQAETQNEGSSSLWSYSSPGSIHHDQLSSLRKNVYQPATKDTSHELNSLESKSEDSKIANPTSSSVLKVWQKRNVSPKELFQFEENLRIWLSMNILQPLVNLIDQCNKALATTAPELQIGLVGIDKLKKAAQNITGVKQLNNLLPFLDITLHQDYLVQRLRELSKGGAISAFQWNAGGSFNGKIWRDEFPTDSYILLHLFALYMDTHLPPDPTQPDGRVFSNVHLVKAPEKPAMPAVQPCLHLTQLNPPHLKVVLPIEGECEVGNGNKNFLHALLLLCHHIIHQEHSHIAGINLKLSGINLAWIVGSE